MTVHICPLFRHIEPLCSSKSTKSALALPLGSRRSPKPDELLALHHELGRRGQQVNGLGCLGDADYANALYGVPAAEAPRAGLPRFDPGSGVESLGVQALVSVPVSEHWRWTAIARGGRILGDRADSPIVDTPAQFFLLTALTRVF